MTQLLYSFLIIQLYYGYVRQVKYTLLLLYQIHPSYAPRHAECAECTAYAPRRAETRREYYNCFVDVQDKSNTLFCCCTRYIQVMR